MATDHSGQSLWSSPLAVTLPALLEGEAITPPPAARFAVLYTEAGAFRAALNLADNTTLTSSNSFVYGTDTIHKIELGFGRPLLTLGSTPGGVVLIYYGQ